MCYGLYLVGIFIFLPPLVVLLGLLSFDSVLSGKSEDTGRSGTSSQLSLEGPLPGPLPAAISGLSLRFRLRTLGFP